MAPKNKAQREDLRQEEILQAVVVADSFNIRFAPITKRKPRTLLPLVNTPLLDYTLEFLCSSGVQEIFVFCCHLADQIKAHLKNSKWSSSNSPCTITTVMSEGCMSTGDAVRAVDAKSLIRNDFILVTGDIVSNLNLNDILQQHKKRREKDKSSLMTMVCIKAPPGHRTRCQEDSVTLMVGDNNRMLYHKKTGQDKRISFPVEELLKYKDIHIRNDLLDSHIYVCTPQVPQLFTDNFDYETCDDFIKGILINEEILGNSIHVNVIEDEYAAKCSNLYMYDAISQDIMSRWTYPYVPESSISSVASDTLSFGRHNVYLSKDVTLARGCVLEENVVIGGNSSLGSNTFISQSVIGKNCKIGENVKIDRSYIWDGVEVQDNCVINTAILCDNVTVYSNTCVSEGCILSWDVKVGPDITLQSKTLLSSSPVSDEDDDFGDDEDDIQLEEKSNQDIKVLIEYGSQSKAFPYKVPVDIDDEDNQLIEDMWGLTVQSDEEESDVSSIASDETNELSQSDTSIPDDASSFYSEMLDTMKRASEENISDENLILEINSLKHAYNIAIKELNKMVMKALMEQPLLSHPDCEPNQMLGLIKPNLAKHKAVVKNYTKSGESQLDCLEAMEEFSISHNGTSCPLLTKLIHYFYESDVFAEQVILKWFATIPDTDSRSHHEAIRKQVEPLINWLKEAEEESSDED